MITFNKVEIVYASVAVALAVYALAFALNVNAAVTTTLDPGDSGTQVTELQTFLAASPSIYPEGLITGYYGSLTTAAVQRFQCQQNIVCSGSPSTTGYGRVGPRTLAAISGTGGPVTDVWAPIISVAVVATTSNSATINWTTNEAAGSRVMYSTSWPFLYASAPSVSAGALKLVPSATLTGLASNTTYYYVRESVDSSGNLQWSASEQFRTNP